MHLGDCNFDSQRKPDCNRKHNAHGDNFNFGNSNWQHQCQRYGQCHGTNSIQLWRCQCGRSLPGPVALSHPHPGANLDLGGEVSHVPHVLTRFALTADEHILRGL